MADEYQKKYRIPSLTTDAIVLRKHKDDNYHDILLVTRGNYPYEGKLAFPGGFVDYGEDPEHGCIRELKEETELDGKDIELLTVRGNPKRDPRRHVVSIFYLVNVDPDSQPKGADDAKDAKFYDLKDIIENKKDELAFDHYGVIKELVEKKFSHLYNIKDKLRGINIPNSFLNIDRKITILLEKIGNIDYDNIDELNELIKQKNEFEILKNETEKLYSEKLEIIRKKINEINSQKWKVFDEKVSKIRELKVKFEKLQKKIDDKKKEEQSSEKLKSVNTNTQSKYWIRSGQNNFPYSGKAIAQNHKNKLKSEEMLKASQVKKNITISTENKIEDNTKNEIIFKKVKDVLDKTVEDVKEIAKSKDEISKIEQIENIKKVTNDAIDQINKLTRYVVDQSNALIEKINENQNNISDKIDYKELKKQENFICDICKKKAQYQVLNQNIKNAKIKKKIINMGKLYDIKNTEDNKKYFEFNAHFKYQDLVNALNEINS